MLGLFIFLFFALWAVIGVYEKQRESQDLRKEAEAQLQDLQKREVALRARIASLKTERGQEAAIRDAYSVSKDGEAMIQIVDKQATSTEQTGLSHPGWLARIFWWW